MIIEPTDCLVVIYAKEPALLAKRFLLDRSPMRVGRTADNEIVLDGDAVSRRHAHFERRGREWFIVDDGSVNGTHRNDEPVAGEAPLRDGDRVKIGPTIFKFLSGTGPEAECHEEVYRMTIFDGLMKIYNKRYLYEALEREIARAHRHNRDLAFLMFDVDHFSRVNDAHGHAAGDFVLQELARVVGSCLRRDDIFARFGGDELCVILPETTLDDALSTAETLRRTVEQHPFVYKTITIHITATFGVTALSDGDRSANDLLNRADQPMVAGKRQGGNRVTPARP